MMIRRQLWVGALLLLAPFALSPLRAEDSPVAGWVRDLDADSFQTRELASQRLLKAGTEAISLLTEASASESPEVVSRALHLLTQLAAAESPLEKGPATLALEKLMATPTRQKHRIRDAHEKLMEARELQAFAALTETGATAFDSYSQKRDGYGLGMSMGERWKGPVQNLAYLKYLRSLYVLQIEWVKTLNDDTLEALFALPSQVESVRLIGTGVTPQGMERLKAKYPKVLFEYHRGGSLGLIKGNSADGVWVYSVMEAATGDRAGIRSGDLLLSSGETVFLNYETYDKWEAKYAVGDRATIRFRREGEEKEVTVTMGRWQESDCFQD